MNKTGKHTWSMEDIKSNEHTTTLSAQLNTLSCPACQSRKFSKNGKEKGNQRYRCSSCGKHFRSTTGNTIHHLHLKPKIQSYIDCMNQGLSLRKTAKKLDISLQTAFRWRHRFLSAMQRWPQRQLHKNKVLSAYTLPYSSKGKPKAHVPKVNITSIIQIDITGKTTVNIIGRYGSPVIKLTNQLQGQITRIKSRTIPRLCKHKTAVCSDEQQITETQLVQKQIHEWLGSFRGVSTKYLENYWSWFALIRQQQIKHSEQLQYMHRCL